MGRLKTPGGETPWVRLHYVYPYPHVDRVIPMMADGLVLPYLDIPFQHASPKVLKAMKRPANEARVLERLKSWRDQVPDIAIRSSFVVGFPGETEEDFQYLLDWLGEAQLDRVGAFKFEPVQGAAANDLPDPVSDEEKQDRYDRIMALSARISAEKLAAKVGQAIDVIIDRVDEQEPDEHGPDRGHFDAPHAQHTEAHSLSGGQASTGGSVGATGRSKADAPEIDGEVHLRDAAGLKPGDFVRVRVEDSDEHDLYGVAI